MASHSFVKAQPHPNDSIQSASNHVTNSCSDQSHVVSKSFLKAVSVSAVSFRVERIFFWLHSSLE